MGPALGLLFLLACVPAVTTIEIDRALPAPGPGRVMILVTGDLAGKVEPCG
jgi:hypothetical protein